jgi:hypothetical protein
MDAESNGCNTRVQRGFMPCASSSNTHVFLRETNFAIYSFQKGGDGKRNFLLLSFCIRTINKDQLSHNAAFLKPAENNFDSKAELDSDESNLICLFKFGCHF